MTTVGRIVFDNRTRPLPRAYSNEELAAIYYRANPPNAGVEPPIPTMRIFNAMRAMLEL